eukprot:403334649
MQLNLQNDEELEQLPKLQLQESIMSQNNQEQTFANSIVVNSNQLNTIQQQKNNNQQSKQSRQQSALEKLIGILQKGSRTRTDRDLQHLVPLIKEIQFFKERDIKDQDFVDIVSCLTYESCQAQDNVFEWDTNGDKFYIILEGVVSVMIPHPDKKDSDIEITKIRKQIEEKKLQLKLVQDQIEWEKREIDLLNSDTMRKDTSINQQLANGTSPTSILRRRLTMAQKSPNRFQSNMAIDEYLSPNQSLQKFSPNSLNKRQSMGVQALQYNKAQVFSFGNQNNNSAQLILKQKQQSFSPIKPINNFNDNDAKSMMLGFMNQLTNPYNSTSYQNNHPLMNQTRNSFNLGLKSMEKLTGSDKQNKNSNALLMYQNNSKISEFDNSDANSENSSQQMGNSRQQLHSNNMKLSIKAQKDLTPEEQKQMLIEQIRGLKKLEQTQYLMEVVQLTAGKSFGELALIKNKPRAATIKCLQPCHFAIMNKTDYQKVLQRIEYKNLHKIVDFLHQVPFMSFMTRTTLSKLQYSFETRTYKRNQVLYREGTQATHVYLIKSGEVEVSKKLVLKAKKVLNTQQYLGDLSDGKGVMKEKKGVISYVKASQDDIDIEEYMRLTGNNENKKQRKGQVYIDDQTKSSKQSLNYKIALLGSGQLLAEDDVLSQYENYSTTTTCKSNECEIFCIKTDEFFRKFKSNQESWKILILMALAKERAIKSKITQIMKIVGQSKGDQSDGMGGIVANKATLYLLNQNEYDLRETLKEIIKEFPTVEEHKKLLSFYYSNIRGQQSQAEAQNYTQQQENSISPGSKKHRHKLNLQETQEIEKKDKTAQKKEVFAKKKTLEFSFQDLSNSNQQEAPNKPSLMEKLKNVIQEKLKKQISQNQAQSSPGSKKKSQKDLNLKQKQSEIKVPIPFTRAYISSKIANVLDAFQKPDDQENNNINDDILSDISPGQKIKRKLSPNKIPFKLDKSSRHMKQKQQETGQGVDQHNQTMQNSKQLNIKLDKSYITSSDLPKDNNQIQLDFTQQSQQHELKQSSRSKTVLTNKQNRSSIVKFQNEMVSKNTSIEQYPNNSQESNKNNSYQQILPQSRNIGMSISQRIYPLNQSIAAQHLNKTLYMTKRNQNQSLNKNGSSDSKPFVPFQKPEVYMSVAHTLQNSQHYSQIDNLKQQHKLLRQNASSQTAATDRRRRNNIIMFQSQQQNLPNSLQFTLQQQAFGSISGIQSNQISNIKTERFNSNSNQINILRQRQSQTKQDIYSDVINSSQRLNLTQASSYNSQNRYQNIKNLNQSLDMQNIPSQSYMQQNLLNSSQGSRRMNGIMKSQDRVTMSSMLSKIIEMGEVKLVDDYDD